MEYFPGHAKFTGPSEISVGDQQLTAKYILVATGTKPIVPQVPGKSYDNHVIYHATCKAHSCSYGNQAHHIPSAW